MLSRLWPEAAAFRERYEPRGGLFWARRVNHSAGAVIALLVLRTRLSANGVTVAGLVVHLLGAAVVGLLPAPAPVWGVALVVLIWQLAYSIDCADGSVARARGQASAFGAWFDQLVDSSSRIAVHTALVVYLVRALSLPGVAAALMASTVVSLALVQTFSSWGRMSLIGGGSPLGDAAAHSRPILAAARHLLDYGAFLFVASVLLLAPVALLVVVFASALVNALFIAAQVALAWRRHKVGPVTDAAGRTAEG